MRRVGSLSAILLGMWLVIAPLRAQDSESRPDTGIIYGQEYVNSYFGFSYHFPAAWSATAGRADMATRIYPLLKAAPSGAGDARYVAVQAERLWQNGSVRTSKDFLAMSVDMLTGPSTGFEALPGSKHYTFGGREFDRIDLRSKAAPGTAMVRQALVATLVRDYAITFQFKASSDVELEDLVSTLQSLSFLDSAQASSAPSSRSASQALPVAAARPASVAPVRVAPDSTSSAPGTARTTTSAPVSSPVVAISNGPAISALPMTSASAVRSAQPVVAATSNAPASAPARASAQPEVPSRSSGANAPSTLIKMATAPHTIPGETLPPTQTEPPQPLVKAPAKSDSTTKTAVMQAVMPAPSATLSPAALNTSTAQPTISVPAPASAQAPAVAQPVAPAQAASTAPVTPVRKPAFTTQTEITRVQISGETLESYVIRKVPAVYPLLARQARIEGLVVLTIVVDEQGQVQEVKAISGPPLLARSAEDALRHWRFRPIIVDGKATQVESRVSMNFQFPH